VQASKTAAGSRCNAHTVSLRRAPGYSSKVSTPDLIVVVMHCLPPQDFSTCTLLFQDSVGGLEVEDPVSSIYPGW
jgi:isopenicillin N synthase-like dioxygenase